MSKNHYRFAVFVLIFTGFFICLISYWLFWPYNLLEVKNNPAPVSKHTIEAGDSFYYTLDFCRYTDLPATVTRQFIDGVIYTTQPINVQDTIKCGSRPTLVVVPPTLVPDDYHLKVIVQIKVNPIRTMTYTFETERFTVTNKKLDIDK